MKKLKDKILIIFNLYGNITRDDINNFELLKLDFVDVVLMEDLANNQKILTEYKVVYDCTNLNNVYNFINGVIPRSRSVRRRACFCASSRRC